MVQYGATLTHFTRIEAGDWPAHLEIDLRRHGDPIPRTIFGNFLEHLGFAIHGGVSAQALSNPGFERVHNLSERARGELLRAGNILMEYSRRGQVNAPAGWLAGIGATGFGAAILDDYTSQGLPLPWAPYHPASGAVSASVGRLGGAVRLSGQSNQAAPAGIRQGVFLPLQRTLVYRGVLTVRPAWEQPEHYGQMRVGLMRRSDVPGQPGECLAEACLEVHRDRWEKLSFELNIQPGSVRPHEALDFYILWLPAARPEPGAADLLVDRAELYPADAVEGFDPDVLRKAREWNTPLLRWPGGNFASQYHWRDGIGDLDRRLTRPNTAWGGLEYNSFGTVEFIHFCRLVNCEPQIVVNTGTGTAEEAAAWVEFCNGSPETPMGRLRAAQGDVEPYHVRLWEVGNEIYGSWQGGYHGAEENALRFSEFAAAMRAVDPSIELIATGNPFDFAQPGLRFDRLHADRRWQRTLLETARAELDYISLHCLPLASDYPAGTSDEEVYYSLLAQPASWEREFLPELEKQAGEIAGKPLRLAITEWGALGGNPHRPRVENYGGALYAGVFLNMLLRNAGRIPVANATALLHGGCIRKAAGQVFVDPQYLALQQYTCLFPGARPLELSLEGPGYDVTVGADLGANVRDVPFIDLAAALLERERGGHASLIISAVNVHRTRRLPLAIRLKKGKLRGAAQLTRLACPDPNAVASLADPDRFALQTEPLGLHDGCLELDLPPCSISWITVAGVDL